MSDLPVPMPVSQVMTKPYINLLLYGPPGKGKTTLAATAQKHKLMENVLFLNFEGGLLSITSARGVLQVPISSVAQLERVFFAIVNKQAGYENIQTVVLDSGSELQNLDLEHTVRANIEAGRKKKIKKFEERSVDEVWQEDYGEVTKRLQRLFRWFRDAQFHFIITALSKEEYTKPASKDEEPKLKAVGPAFTSKLATTVMGICDFVWFLDQSPSGERCLLTQQSGVFIAKTRGEKFAPGIGDVIKVLPGEPLLATLYQKLLDLEYPDYAAQLKEEK